MRDLQLPSQPQSTTTASWLLLISRLSDSRRLLWTEWLVTITYQDGTSANGHISQY